MVENGLDTETLQIIEKLLEQEKYRKMYVHKPYPWQQTFHNAGKDNSERLLMAANGVGKTMTGAYETAIHLTGLYPSWWEGRRYAKPVKWWGCSISADSQKEYVQPSLLGPDLGEGYGIGFIPLDRLGKPSTRQAGISGVVDTVNVRHTSGGQSQRKTPLRQA